MFLISRALFSFVKVYRTVKNSLCQCAMLYLILANCVACKNQIILVVKTSKFTKFKMTIDR